MLGWFLAVTVLSYLVLPEGVLRNRNPLQGWGESDDVAALAGQIFVFNLISVAIIALASLFANRRDGSAYLSVGYAAFFVLITINALTLGTWSFVHGSDAPGLLERLLGMLTFWERSGLWEMGGQLIITCALARIALVRTTGRTTQTRGVREVRLSRGEWVAVLVGLALMLTGAVIESVAIHAG